MARPEIVFVADDFTGACDTLATLARGGLRTRLFTRCPEIFPDDLDAIGVATALRSMPPEEGIATMEQIAPRIASIAPRITHYKVCSTSTARPRPAISQSYRNAGFDLGADWIAIVGGQPSLRRYCVFATLYAAAGDGTVHRIDRHPVMKVHPTTPMGEADLRRHLARTGVARYRAHGLPKLAIAVQTSRRRWTTGSRVASRTRLRRLDVQRPRRRRQAIREQSEGQSVLCIGASSVAEAMLASSGSRKVLKATNRQVPFRGTGLCDLRQSVGNDAEPDRASQSYSKIWAKAADFLPDAPERAVLMKQGVRILASGKNLLVAVSEERHEKIPAPLLSPIFADFAAELIERASPGCLFVAGGDTSSALVSALDVESLEFVRDIDRGVPLVGATSAGTAGGLAMVLKGGQMGQLDVFRFRGHARYVVETDHRD